MRARLALLVVALLALPASGLGHSSDPNPRARASVYELVETFTWLPNTEVTAQTQFRESADYAIVMTGTWESWNNGTDYRNQWDPWYFYGCTGNCGSTPVNVHEDHRPLAYDRRTGKYVALSYLGHGTKVPQYNGEGHSYRLLLSDFGGELKLKDRLGPFFHNHDGSFAFKIYEKVTPKVAFDFLQQNLRGHVRTTTRGKGVLRLIRRPDLRSDNRRDQVGVVNDSLEGLVIRHRDEYVVRDDDVLRLKVENADYRIAVEQKAVYESILFKTRVVESSDPSCREGARVIVGIVEAKGAGGKGKVAISAGKPCEDHNHRTFTERDKGDTVRVEVKGPRPQRN